jgi:hypothetical protein
MKITKIKTIDIPFTSWDFHYLNDLLILFGHEGPAKIFKIENCNCKEVKDIGEILRSYGGNFVNTSEICPGIVLFGDYGIGGNIYLVSYNTSTSETSTIGLDLKSSSQKIEFSPNNQFVAIAGDTDKSNIIVFDIKKLSIISQFSGRIPLKWNDESTLIYKKSDEIIKRNIFTGVETTIIEKIEGFSVNSIDVNELGILFSMNQEHEYMRNTYSYTVSKFNDFSRCIYQSFKTDSRTVIYEANCYTDNVKIINNETFLVVHGWHGDNTENGNLYIISMDKNNHLQKIPIANYDSGYGHEGLYTPYSVIQLKNTCIFGLRRRNGKLKIVELSNGTTKELNIDLIDYADNSNHWQNEIFSCKFMFDKDELLLIANQKRHISVIRIEI